MTGPPIIQIPMLRPDPIHEGPGLAPGTAPQDQLMKLAEALDRHQQGIQQLMAIKGHLALEQEKFDAEQSQRNDKKKQLQQLNDSLTQAFQHANTPQGLMSALQQAIPQMAGVGETSGAAAAMRELPGLQGQISGQATQQAIGGLLNNFANGNVRDPVAQGHLLSSVAALSPDAAGKISEALRGVQSDVEWHMGNDGKFYGLDKRSHSWFAGPDTGPKSGQGVAPEKLKSAAIISLQGLLGMEHTLQDNPDADMDPVFAAALREGKVLGLQAQPLVNAFQDPNKLIFRRHLMQAVDGYMGMFGTSAARSPTIFKALLGAMAPMGGESDPSIRTDAAAFRANMRQLVSQVAQGKGIDMTKMPFFGDFMTEQSAQQSGGQPTPGTLNFGNYLNPPQPQQPQQ